MQADHTEEVVETSTPNDHSREPFEDDDLKEHSAPPSSPHDEEESFFSLSNLKVALVPACGGGINGITIGYVAVYSQMYLMGNDCSKYYAGRTACETLSFGDCRYFTNLTADAPDSWHNHGGYCGWSDITCRVAYPNSDWAGHTDDAARSACLDDNRCTWSYKDKECQNPAGYDSLDSGIFAASMILGCAIGAISSGPLVTRIGSKLSFLIIGLGGLVCSMMYHLSLAENEFWVMNSARLTIGLFVGMAGVACPLYVDQNANPKFKCTLGSLYQIFTTFGIFVDATMGLGVGQSVWYSENKDQYIMSRMQSFAGLSSLMSTLFVLLSIVSKETQAKFDQDEETAEENTVQLKSSEYTITQMIPQLLMGIAVAGSLQLTGINAVMNYAPTIMGNLGTAPLVGNWIVMMWNFVTTLGSLPLTRFFKLRPLFLAGSFLSAAMCLLLCGVPVYPGVASTKSVKDGVATTGILLFIMSFEFAVGPCYYVLTQDLFPPSFRPIGCSWTQFWQFFFTVLINAFYPTAVEHISGGASGDQDKGQAIAFIFFGAMGLMCFIFEVFFLFPWEDPKGNAQPQEPAAAISAPESLAEEARNQEEV